MRSQPDVLEAVGSSGKFLDWDITVIVVGRVDQVATCQIGPHHLVIRAFQGEAINATRYRIDELVHSPQEKVKGTLTYTLLNLELPLFLRTTFENVFLQPWS